MLVYGTYLEETVVYIELCQSSQGIIFYTSPTTPFMTLVFVQGLLLS